MGDVESLYFAQHARHYTHLQKLALSSVMNELCTFIRVYLNEKPQPTVNVVNNTKTWLKGRGYTNLLPKANHLARDCLKMLKMAELVEFSNRKWSLTDGAE